MTMDAQKSPGFVRLMKRWLFRTHERAGLFMLRRRLTARRMRKQFNPKDEIQLDIVGEPIRFTLTDDLSLCFFYPDRADGSLYEAGSTGKLVELLESTTCFVDIGAHIGWFACTAAAHLRNSGHVHAFEMNRRHFDILESNIRLNGFSNIEAVNMALSDRSGSTSYVGMSLVDSELAGMESGRTDTVSLDSYFQDKDHLPDLIKIDVEGAELKVLTGAKETIARGSPRILIEVHPHLLFEFNASSGDVLMFLDSLGYQLDEIIAHRRTSSGQRLQRFEKPFPDFQDNKFFLASKGGAEVAGQPT